METQNSKTLAMEAATGNGSGGRDGVGLVKAGADWSNQFRQRKREGKKGKNGGSRALRINGWAATA